MSAVITFPHVEGHWSAEETALQRDLARIMVATAKKHMPGVPVKMWTDENTRPIEGIDEVLRKPIAGWSWIPWVCDFAAQTRGEVLYMDTDVVIQHDLRPLFSVPADVVFTYRGMKEIDGRFMPFIFGVVPYKNPEFWIEVRDRVLKMEKVDQNWYGSQMAVFDMWMAEQQGRGQWRIASVDREKYNYTPNDASDAPTEKWVLHYKGKKRKAWMRDRFKHLLDEKVAA